MKMKVLLVVVLFFVLSLITASVCCAAIYKYVDKNGIVTFADDLQSIPEAYRATSVIVSGEAKEGDEKGPAVPTMTEAQSEIQTAAPSRPHDRRSAETTEKSTFIGSALTSAIIIVSALFALVILGVVDADNKKAMTIARLIIIWGVSVYLIYAHAGDVIRIFTSMGGTIENAKHESEEKGKKAAIAIKNLNALAEETSKVDSRASEGAGSEKKE